MPLIPGHEFSGEVVKLGKRADRTWLGKRVGIFPLIPCRECESCLRRQYEMCRYYSYLGSRRDGGFAEYVAVPEWNLISLSDNISYEEAAMLEPMAVAIHALRRVQPHQTDTVAVAGLGTIGLLLTMFLIEQGIQDILVIGNKDFQRQSVVHMGIHEDHFCDSRKTGVKEWLLQHTEGRGVDDFFECVGKNETITQAIDLTAPTGRICLVGNPHTDMTLPKDTYWKILRNQLQVTGTWNSSYRGNEDADDWQYVLGRLSQGKIAPAELITHRLPPENLEQGFQLMRDKSEDYIKILMVNEGNVTPAFAGEAYKNG